MHYAESSNHRPGEPLRSWLDVTAVVTSDALANIHFAHAGDALKRLLAGAALSDSDVIALGRLNSFCVVRWYEPMVTLLDKPFIDPDVAGFIEPLLPKIDSAAPGVSWSQ